MPHKHKRDNLKSPSSYNLPPSQIAYPLTTAKKPAGPANSAKRKPRSTDDDTPRAFTRLLGAYRPPRSGLDDGTRPSKKRKIGGATSTSEPAALPPTKPEPTLGAPVRQHNESLGAFAARVDAALPFSGIQKKSGTLKGIDKGRQTRTEKKMQRMYSEWREEDKRMRERALGEASLDDEGEEDDDEGFRAMGVGKESEEEDIKRVGKRKAKKGKKKRGIAGVGGDSDNEDPWAKIAAKRKDVEGNGGLVGLHDVVQAPPRFTKVPKSREAFKVGTGGLKRQVELSEARQSVVEGYRQMMRDKRAPVV